MKSVDVRLPAALVASAVAALLPGCTHRTRPGAPAASALSTGSSAGAPPSAIVANAAPARARPSGPLRFVAIGGGATPESTEISLEQDIELVAGTLPLPGTVLFAGGSGSLSVREANPRPHGDSVLLALGDLFHPRAGRQSRYGAVRLDAARASVENVEATLGAALSSGEGPLLLYIAAHGDQGEAPRDNLVALWGGQPLTVARLAELHEQHPRPLRLVVTSCFSGGFGELAFEHADERKGPSHALRCGVFAGPWDRETSGCDPNPDRKAQESYGLHFIHALAGKDRDGHPLPESSVDFNHDGKVGLLDAHTRARIAAMSLDVPTTTSERFLRSAEHGSAAVDRAVLPEDAAVVDALGAALGLKDEAAVEKRWNELDAHMTRLDDALNDAQSVLAVKESTLGSRLLERWPMLDDAFHPDFAETFRKNRDAIAEVLEHSPEALARAKAREEVDGADEELSGLEVEEARLLRLRRAYETLHLAAALLHKGGPAARYYSALLGCERAAP
ncbi:MAG TPA: hypothetical protein VHU80_13570 [Polyangiaceae bacterium]|nr:hypothetical protein [Polyangiaceae bacterium]